MKRTLIAAAACAGLLLAPVADAKPGNGNGSSTNPTKVCNAMKKADKEAFEAVWGKHAMRDCKRANRGTETSPADAAEGFENAAKECRAEREADPAGFAATYGTNRNDRNAFGKCVSSHVHDDPEEEPPVA